MALNLVLFEKYARWGWPLHRRLVRGLARRCRRCVISERCAPLDRQGVCRACAEAGPSLRVEPASPSASQAMQAEFDALLRGMAGKGPAYDAALLLSGGKDSAYILYRLRKQYPDLRLLCILVDNGFMARRAMENAAHVAEAMRSDLLVDRGHIPEFAGTLRQAFVSLRGRGAYEVIDRADGDLIFQTGRAITGRMGIPLLVNGLSWVQMQRIFGVREGFDLPPRGPFREVCPLAVWRPGEQDIRRMVVERGLIPAGNDSPLATNSALVTPMSVIDVLNLGYCSFEPEFSQLVREGKTDPWLWRNIFELLEYGVRTGRLVRDADEILSRLQLTVGEIVSIDKRHKQE